MSERSDRRIPGGGWQLAIGILAVIFLFAAGGGVLWYRLSRGPQAEPPVPQDAQTRGPLARPDEPLMVTLFLPAEGRLASVAAAVKRQHDVQLQAREAVAAVLKGERASPPAVLKELKLRALYLDGSGTGYLDLSFSFPHQKEIRASAADELLAVYALVNTLAQNAPEVRQVRFLVDGREVQTLAGHVDLSRAFVKRMDLVKQ